jgi:hypothetical protein
LKVILQAGRNQKQENQISAMRACIQQGVDVIALPPVVETGWDTVMAEAKSAGIPVVLTDRAVQVLGVSEDAPDAQKKFQDKYTLPFTLVAHFVIAAPDAECAQRADTQRVGRAVDQPAERVFGGLAHWRATILQQRSIRAGLHCGFTSCAATVHASAKRWCD